LKATGGKKADRSAALLGYTPEQLQEHILNHPNMASLQGKEWHVDHIFPIQAFLDHGIEDLRLINALDNLQPLEGSENISKGDGYDTEQFLKWMQHGTNLPGNAFEF
jgi:5-methylcytosine-specific restriction endonuclease McrA